MLRPTMVALLVGVGLGVACSVSFPDDAIYSCKTEADCAGEGYVCAPRVDKDGWCCLPSNGGVEICDEIDNDCDGTVDDGFDLRNDDKNCGECGRTCTSKQHCFTGTCVQNATIPCEADGGCTQLSCDRSPCNPLGGCVCRGLARYETICNDTVDNDTDGLADCLDADCNGGQCGDGGCICAGGMKTEGSCVDGRDNDGDFNADCGDSDCDGKICQTGTGLRCANTVCQCNGGAPTPEDGGGATCRDGLDNDCNGKTDCEEITACDNASCNPDGGMGCLCVNGLKNENNCRNSYDDDGDSKLDCFDNDCLFNSCIRDGGSIGSCMEDGGCE